jgi:hypothetical protein
MLEDSVLWGNTKTAVHVDVNPLSQGSVFFRVQTRKQAKDCKGPFHFSATSIQGGIYGTVELITPRTTVAFKQDCGWPTKCRDTTGRPCLMLRLNLTVYTINGEFLRLDNTAHHHSPLARNDRTPSVLVVYSKSDVWDSYSSVLLTM